MKKFLFFDMDGTLISIKNHQIPKSAIEAIQQAIGKGHICFICTGRAYQMAREFEDVLSMPGIIFCNGAGIVYEQKILEVNPIPRKQVEEIVELAERLGGAYQLLTTNHEFQNEKQRKGAIRRLANRYPDLTAEQVLEKRAMVRMQEYNGEPIQKIDAYFANELTADIFFSRVPKELTIIRNGGYYAGFGSKGGELTAPGISKGTGILHALKLLGGNVENTYCFGDSANDMEMMKVCAHSVAMGNGSEDVKKNAEYVTEDVDQDGIYKALLHYGLIEE